MTSREEVLSILLGCVREVSAQTGAAVEAVEATPLLGTGSPLDSLALVMVIADFEARLNERYDTGIVLASEAAMSMSRSPFRSVATLADYAHELLTARSA